MAPCTSTHWYLMLIITIKQGKEKSLLAGDTFIMFVSWDPDGVLSSQSIHQFGTATMDASAPHYSDQAPLFAAMRFKPVLFTEEQLAGNVVETYRPGQRG